MWRLYEIFNIPCIFCYGCLLKFALQSTCHTTFSTPFSISFFLPNAATLPLFTLYFILTNFFVFMCVCVLSFSSLWISKAVTEVGENEKYVECEWEYLYSIHSKYFQVDDYFDMKALGVLNLSFSHSTSLTYGYK